MIMEVALALMNAPDDAGGERVKEGDIVALRPPGTGVGTKESKLFLWLRLEGLDTRAEYDVLTRLSFEPDDEDTGTKYDKRRYSIPLRRIKRFDPGFSLPRARDPADQYQPYILMDEEDLTYLAVNRVFDLRGLVFDKGTGDYL